MDKEKLRKLNELFNRFSKEEKMKKMKFFLYIKLIRVWLSPLLYYIYKIKHNLKMSNKWDKAKDYTINEFSRLLAEYDYVPDPLNGKYDFSPLDKNYFFLGNRYSTDCDDWARMWYWYHKHHNREVYEVAMLDVDKNSGHMVTVAKVNGKYQLFDYTPVQRTAETIKDVLSYNVVGYENFLWVINKPYWRWNNG